MTENVETNIAFHLFCFVDELGFHVGQRSRPLCQNLQNS